MTGQQWPNLSDDFFEVPSHDYSRAVVHEFVEFDRDNDRLPPDSDFIRCMERSPSGTWLCNYAKGHIGHHDAWTEGEGHHLAHWWNENAEFVIHEEEDLEVFLLTSTA